PAVGQSDWWTLAADGKVRAWSVQTGQVVATPVDIGPVREVVTLNEPAEERGVGFNRGRFGRRFPLHEGDLLVVGADGEIRLIQWGYVNEIGKKETQITSLSSLNKVTIREAWLLGNALVVRTDHGVLYWSSVGKDVKPVEIQHPSVVRRMV